MYFDAVAYGAEELEFVSAAVGRAGKYDEGSGREALLNLKSVGSKRMMWGTDHPFFPPLSGDKEAKWASVVENLQAIDGVDAWSEEDKRGVRGDNAIRLFRLGDS